MTANASVLAYFEAKLRCETDPSDVYASRQSGEDVALIDVRSAEAWDQGHAAGAVHLPYREISARASEMLPLTTPLVVYCWSPGCNAGAKAALEFARLGYDVREMIGGYEYWMREGYPTEGASGPLPRTFDPLVMVVRPSAR